MRQIAQNRSDYTRLIIHYKHKREAIKQKFQRGDPKYALATKQINRKLSTYKNAINRIDAYNIVLRQINSTIKEYYGISVHKSVQQGKALGGTKYRLLTKMFCKYAIEKGIPNLYISNFIGWSKKRASIYRLKLTRSMQTNELLLKEWHKFRKFMERPQLQQTA